MPCCIACNRLRGGRTINEFLHRVSIIYENYNIRNCNLANKETIEDLESLEKFLLNLNTEGSF